MEHILTMGDRQWNLSDREFKEFELRYEENELIEIPEGQTVEEFAKGFKVTFT